MASGDLNPSSFALREANAEEKVACWRASSTLWAKKLSVEEFIEQEEINGSGELTRNGGIRYWAFTGPGSEGDTGTQIYSAVQTLKKDVVVKTADGAVKTESAYAIAGVFTPAAFRRRGIASAMLQRLREWLDGAQASSRVSVLFTSLTNLKLYEPLGWRRFPAFETELGPADTNSDAKPITVDTLSELCDRDVAAIIETFRKTPLAEGTHTQVAFLPTYAQAMWHFGAEEFAASKLSASSSRKPSIKGAMAASGNTWGYWHHIFNYETLMFLRIVSLNTDSTPEEEERSVHELAEVLRAGQREAADWSFKKVVIWNPDVRVQTALELVLKGAKPVVTERNGSLPCLRWKGDNGGGQSDRGIDWTVLEKYCWC